MSSDVGTIMTFGLVGALLGALTPKMPTIEQGKLAEKTIQTSTYGTMLPRFYGTIGVSGNVTWLENNQLKETVRKKKQGGKGGGSKTTVKTYSYSATFILSLGIGPIAGVRRIWCSDRLIYNAGSDDLETIIASNQNAAGFKVYLGTDDQLPDPRYEADVGVGNAPAYRGEAYIAFYDFQLADYSNTLQGAQFKVEVVSAATENQYQLLSSKAITYFNKSGPASVSADGLHLRRLDLSGTAPILQTYSNGQLLYAKQLPGSIGTFTRSVPCFGSAEYCLANFGDLVIDGESFSAPLTIESFALTAGKIGGRIYFAYVPTLGLPQITLITSSTLPVIPPVTRTADLFCAGPSSFLFLRQVGANLEIAEYDLDLDLVTTKSFPYSGGAGNAKNAGFDGDTLRIFDTDTGSLAEIDYASGATVLHSLQPLLYGTIERGIVKQAYGVLSLCMPGATAADETLQQYKVTDLAADLVPLGSIVATEVSLSSLLGPSDILVGDLAAGVRGYRVSGGSIRSALEPLQGAFPFDIIQSGYQLKCVPRGQASVMTIPWQDLGATDGDTPGDLLKESREMDTQLPALVAVKYLDAAREYAVAEQSKPRLNTQAINRVDRELALVLTADEAAGVAEVLCELPWLERTPASFSLPPPYLALEPADVVTIVAPWATYEVRLTEGNYTPSGRGEWDAKPNRAALYTSNAKGAEGVPPSGTIPVLGQTLLLPMDIPTIDETLQNAPGFACVAVGYSPSWPGAVAFRSVDAGQTWMELQGFSGLPTLGYARATLPASACTVIDQRSLVVDLLAGELESITRDQLLTGQNYAAYGVDGRWEIVRFQNASLQADGSYLLSGFVRGDRGTEWATGLHQAGDYFVLLDDPDNVIIDMAVGSIGVPATYRGVTSGASIDSASDVLFTYQGVNLECLSPVSARGVRDGSGNFSGSFTRRSRLSSSWWTTGVSAPIGETTEAYEIDVMSGATVKRTITASSPSFSYSAASQATDFGSAQAAITFRIYQRSEVVGRGYPLEVTL